MNSPEIIIVDAWHDALNRGDIERLDSLSTDDIELGGPRGSGHGVQLLREWFGRAGIHVEPREVFHRGKTVVVEQNAAWRNIEPTECQIVASVFLVQDGRIASVIRHPDLSSALAAAGLTEADKV
jgi:ketosteroid isomerase-like protein